MKILHIIPTLGKGGAERITLDICLKFTKKGHDVKLIALSPVNHYKFISNQINFQNVRTSLKLSMFRKNKVDIDELQNQIDTFRPDVIHSHLFESEINLAFCNIPLQTKRVIHFHDNMTQMKAFHWKLFFSKKSITNFYERYLVLKNTKKNKTVAIGVSSNTMIYIDKMIPSRINRILLPNAINLERFSQITQLTDRSKIITIGTLNDNKDQSLAIYTIAELKKRNITTTLTIVGDGPNAKALMELSKTLNLENQIIFTGHCDFPETYLQKSSIYLHTSKSESFGLVLIEAMACGLPVVCTDATGNRDLINDGENGFFISIRDSKILADKIQLLIENEKEYSRLSINACNDSLKYGLENYYNTLLNIYK